jgi:ketosteroid isomerase-like protein
MFNQPNERPAKTSFPSVRVMKQAVVAILLILGVIAPTLAQDQDNANPTPEKKSASESKAEAEVVGALRARKDAAKRHDIEAWAAFLADDCVFTGGGRLKSKQDAVKENKSEWANIPPEVKGYGGPLEDIRVTIHGDAAIAFFKFKEFVEMGGQTTSSRSWQMDTFMRRGNKWLLVASGDAVLPPEPRVVKVDPSIYDAYVGQYELAPKIISTVSREGDKLIGRLPGQEPIELLPENDTTFFVRGMDGERYIIVKDASGRVTHAIQKVFGWTDLIVKKIK